LALQGGTRLVLNAAPPAPLPDVLWDAVDVLVVNEHEAIALADGEDEAPSAAAILAKRVGAVVLTQGAGGCVVLVDGEEPTNIPAPTVPTVDTTGAGDTFCGVLAAALAS